MFYNTYIGRHLRRLLDTLRKSRSYWLRPLSLFRWGRSMSHSLALLRAECIAGKEGKKGIGDETAFETASGALADDVKLRQRQQNLN